MPAKTAAKRARSKSPEPKPIRPDMPAAYSRPGSKPNFVPWSFAEQRLTRSHNYWICSTRPDGRPHSAPVWGIWLDDAFYFSTDPSSRKGQNLKHNPAVSVHVDSGDEPVILEGRIELVELDKRIDAAYQRKYKLHLLEFPGPAAVYRLKPKTVLAWREKNFDTSATKWKLY